MWDEGGYFDGEPDPARKSFAIVIPPPNITGALHMGHALNNVLQDILVRFRRMQGYGALWIPGTDHASIATQNVVERQLAKEGKTRQDLGREKFLERVWQWRNEYGNRILDQLRRLGSSCDWRRTRFTMDEGLSRAVTEAFVSLHRQGLIYRGKYIVNWCPRCQTTLADDEVSHEDTSGKLWYIRYPLASGKGHISVATTRPETMLGDTAVAVNPKDTRYKKLIGEVVTLPETNREIPIIADDWVDAEFGTGAVKVTPAHDPNDFQIGLRHNLPQINVMTEDGRMSAEAPAAYQGLDRFECREKLVARLDAAGLLEKTDDHELAIAHCYRCETVIEPYLSDQWFVKVGPLASRAIEAVEDGRIRFVPKRYEKMYLDWLENLRDWPISRQLWWGHRIPVWYCEKCGEAIVSTEAPKACPACGGGELMQDEDVLDTWFSSALWPFSTLGWPEKTPELGYFYPTDVLVTNRDIITLWVSRMVMMGLECMGDIPFHTVYIHAKIL
ncbi:MAG: valine--tRNA ligase, partial [Phycisphaerae bacterium]|nr:valine--tRNA ligase [Phycisphaerae bacterium]